MEGLDPLSNHEVKGGWRGVHIKRMCRAKQQNHLMRYIGSAPIEKEALDGSSSPDTLPDTRPGLSL